MHWGPRRGLRRHLSLAVSGGLVLLIGGLGLVGANAAEQQAREVHRADRLALQNNLAGLVEQYALVNAAEVADALGDDGPWPAEAGDPQAERRLQALVLSTRALDAGAVLLDGAGRPLAAWSGIGALPAQDDPGWAPLRAAVAAADGTLPLSGILPVGQRALLAMGLPVPLADGSRGLVVGLWDARKNGLQNYVSDLEYGKTGHGYVVDHSGRIVGGPDVGAVGSLLPPSELRNGVLRGGSGLLDTHDGDKRLMTVHSEAGDTSWIALTVQDWSEFEGGLVRSRTLIQGAVVTLLLIAGGGLVVLNRKRETALEVAALHDDLTGLHNRRGWFLLAAHELERARRQQSARVLLFVDVDGLKQVNDVLGHREGDAAIVAAAEVLRAACRSSDVVGRIGGDEFVLLLGEEGQVDVARRRLLDALDAYNARSGAGFELRLSVGAEVWFPDDALTLDELVRRADEEMYVDKSSRPGRHEGVLRVPPQRGPAVEASNH